MMLEEGWEGGNLKATGPWQMRGLNERNLHVTQRSHNSILIIPHATNPTPIGTFCFIFLLICAQLLA